MGESGMEMEGYTKIVRKKYNKAFYEFEDERIPNANVRGSEKVIGSGTGPYGTDPVASQTIITITIPAGQQLRLMYLNFWSKDELNDAQLVIEQAGGTSHGLPAGQVDALMIPHNARVPLVLKGTYVDPVHILEGTVTFKLQNPTVGAEYGLSIWGDQNKPQIER